MTPHLRGTEPEEPKRYRMRQEVKRGKAKKALKEQGKIALVTFAIIGIYWVTHHLELIERELLENPHWTFGKHGIALITIDYLMQNTSGMHSWVFWQFGQSTSLSSWM